MGLRDWVKLKLEEGNTLEWATASLVKLFFEGGLGALTGLAVAESISHFTTVGEISRLIGISGTTSVAVIYLSFASAGYYIFKGSYA
jgi:hypothetical protein